jgi:hypothetical protein
MPFAVRVLSWMFVVGPHRDFCRRGAQRVFGVK